MLVINHVYKLKELISSSYIFQVSFVIREEGERCHRAGVNSLQVKINSYRSMKNGLEGFKIELNVWCDYLSPISVCQKSLILRPDANIPIWALNCVHPNR